MNLCLCVREWAVMMWWVQRTLGTDVVFVGVMAEAVSWSQVCSSTLSLKWAITRSSTSHQEPETSTSQRWWRAETIWVRTSIITLNKTSEHLTEHPSETRSSLQNVPQLTFIRRNKNNNELVLKWTPLILTVSIMFHTPSSKGCVCVCVLCSSAQSLWSIHYKW